MSKIITVFGATGNQGGSVIAAIQRHPELSKTYKIRAVTRDTSKPNAQKLKEHGAEVVKADMNDLASLREAMRGAYAVFGVTNFWEGMDGSLEEKQGKALGDAAVAEGVHIIVFSSLPAVSKITNGKLKHVVHFDHKANVEEYIKTLPIKSAFYWPSFYMQNFQSTFGPSKNEDGSYTLYGVWAPDTQVPLVDAAADSGKFVTPILLNPDKFNHKRMYGAVAFYTPEQIVSIWSKGTGEKISYKQIPDETYKSNMPPALADELTENGVYMRDYNYFGSEGKDPQKGLEETLNELNEKPVTWEEFVKDNKWFQ